MAILEVPASRAAQDVRWFRVLRVRVPVAWVHLAVLFIFVTVQPLARTIDPDLWWHLRTGDIILHSGIPRHDPYSWTAGGHAWVAHEWLSEAVLYSVDSTLGYAGNVAIMAVATIVALVLMYALPRKLGVAARPLVLLMVLSCIMLALLVSVRPQVFTWTLFAVFVYVLARHDEGDNSPLWALPPLMALWVNLHLGFVYGLMAVGAWFVARLFERARGRQVDIRTPAMVAAACILATFLNPWGPSILAYPLRYWQDRSSMVWIGEWQRPSPLDPLMAPLFLATLLMALSLASKERPRPFLFILAIPVIVLGLQAARNMAFVGLLLLPVAGPVLAGRFSWARGDRDSKLRLRLVHVAALVALVAFANLTRAVVMGNELSILDRSENHYPSGGAAYAAENLQGRHLYNEYTWGGYLIDKLYPQVPLFIDGRSDFYRSRIMDDYASIGMLKPGWPDLMDQYGIDSVLLRKNSRLAKELRQDDRWQEVFTGDVESILVRR